jgi:hypothetical protein
MWPSWKLAIYMTVVTSIYGSHCCENICLSSLYGNAFQYADKTLNEGGYTGSLEQAVSSPDSIKNYIRAVSEDADLLDFILYVPAGYGSLEAYSIPNVEETDDPEKIFTSHFNGGLEVW